MKVMIFGATGMVGQGVLRECLLDPAVTEVLAIPSNYWSTITRPYPGRNCRYPHDIAII